MSRTSLNALLWLLVAGIVVMASVVSAQPPKASVYTVQEIAILKIEATRVDAVLKGDRATLDRIFADDLSYVHASGRVDTKATMLADVASGRMKYKKFDESDQHVRLYAASAVVTGKASVDVDIDQKNLVLAIQFTGVYVKEPDGSWKMVAWQSTKLPD